MTLNDYFYEKFPTDLRRVLADKYKNQHHQEMFGLFFGENDWASFLSDIDRVDDKASFLLSLFMIILTDQALYSFDKTEGKSLHDLWEKYTNFPHFGHVGFGPHNQNPFLILYKAEKEIPQVADEIIKKMPQFVEFLVNETKTYFDKLFSDKLDIQAYFDSILNDSAYTLKGHKSAGALDQLNSSRCMKAFKSSFESKVKAS